MNTVHPEVEHHILTLAAFCAMATPLDEYAVLSDPEVKALVEKPGAFWMLIEALDALAYHDFTLTKEQKKHGWHYCPDFNGALLKPGDHDRFKCRCEERKKQKIKVEA